MGRHERREEPDAATRENTLRTAFPRNRTQEVIGSIPFSSTTGFNDTFACVAANDDPLNPARFNEVPPFQSRIVCGTTLVRHQTRGGNESAAFRRFRIRLLQPLRRWNRSFPPGGVAPRSNADG